MAKLKAEDDVLEYLTKYLHWEKVCSVRGLLFYLYSLMAGANNTYVIYSFFNNYYYKTYKCSNFDPDPVNFPLGIICIKSGHITV